VDAVIYLVDAVDSERFPEAKKELDNLLATEALANTPFLILGNKIDMPYACSEEQLKMNLGLSGLTTGKDVTSLSKDIRPLEVFMCSILRKAGYPDGLKWLTNFL
jgi:GTP-binding protein SAR1